MTGDIDDLADEIQPWNSLRLHRLRREFIGVDPAGGDFGFFISFGAVGFELPMMQPVFKLLDCGVRPSWRIGEIDEAIGKPRSEMTVQGGLRCGRVTRPWSSQASLP